MAKTKTRTEKPTISAETLLGTIGSKPAAKSKNTTPIIKLHSKEEVKQIAAIVDAKQKKKEAESAVKIAEGDFTETAKQLFENKCRTDATVHSSVKFVGSANAETHQVTYTEVHRLCEMKETDASEPLRRIFGEDFDEYFQVIKPLAIACEKLTDAQIVKIVQSLQATLDEATFNEVVSYTAKIVPKDSYFTRKILDPEVTKKARMAESEGFAKPFAGSFRI